MAGRHARVAELVDARDLKSLGRKAVPVRFRSRAPERKVGFYEPAFFICPLAGEAGSYLFNRFLVSIRKL